MGVVFIDFKRPMVPLCDADRDAEPKSRAFADFLGREERLKKAFTDFVWDAVAAVCYGDADVSFVFFEVETHPFFG